MEVEIISTTFVKPSLPTPTHLKTHKLSSLDQLPPSVYVPCILFYPKLNQEGNDRVDIDVDPERSLLLKQSLAKTLTHFYPLAGKIKDDFFIDCDDEGACYVVARVRNSSLEEYLNHPDLASLNKFLPVNSTLVQCPHGSRVTMIKETTFPCGSVVIGFLLSHQIIDGVSMSSFLKSWATIARNSFEEFIMPNFDAPSVFPPIHPFPREASFTDTMRRFTCKGRGAQRRFVFNPQSIANLKENLACSTLPNLTRVELVSALLIKCITVALNKKLGAHQPTVVVQAVDLRRRMVPPLMQHAMGNHVLSTKVLFEAEETELSGIVHRSREAVAKFDGAFIEKLKGADGVFRLCELLKGRDYSSKIRSKTASSSGVNYVVLTSWCNFGLYEVDFGWGKPLWVTASGSDMSQSVHVNSVILLDMKTERGIEAVVSLGEEEMAMLEANKELLAYASLDPSPLQFNHVV